MKGITLVGLVGFLLAGPTLLGAEERITNYHPGVVTLEGAYAVRVEMESVGDGYARRFSAWIEDGSGGFLNLYGDDCDPEEWKRSHCSGPVVGRHGTVTYDLSRYTETPYSGQLVFAISSYVGYWRVRVTAIHEPLPAVRATTAGEPAAGGRTEVDGHRELVCGIKNRCTSAIPGSAVHLCTVPTACKPAAPRPRCSGTLPAGRAAVAPVCDRRSAPSAAATPTPSCRQELQL